MSLARFPLDAWSPPRHTLKVRQNFPMKTHSVLLAGFLCAPLALGEAPTIESLALKVEALERQVESLRSDLDAAKKEKDGVADSDKVKHAEIIINIHKDGKIRVEGREMSDKELAARIEATLKKSPNQPIRIRADGEVRYQDVVRVIDLCQRAGAWDLSFATREPEDETSLLTPDPPPVPAAMAATTSTPCSALAPGQG